MARSCPVLLEYLPWAGLDTRQAKIAKTRHRSSGTVEECFQSVPVAKKRMRVLRRHRVVEYVNIYSGSRSNLIANWDAGRKKRR